MGEQRRKNFPRIHLIASSCLVLAACIGNIGDGTEDGDGPKTAVEQSGWSTPAMKRLTQAQYENSIHDVFGPNVQLDRDIADDETNELFLSMGASKVGTGEYAVELYHQAALSIANQVVADAANQPVLKDCVPFEPGEACVSQALTHYAERLWRRPVSAEEIAPVATIVGEPGLGNAEEWELGMIYAIASLIDAPSFLYLPEVGELDPDTGYYRYTSIEMASRLSFTLWNTTPDAELLDAAVDGDLVGDEALRQQVERMIDDPRAQDLATRFFGEAWFVAGLDFTDKNTDVIPNWTPELVDAFQQEFDLVLRDMMERDADIFELFTGSQTFVDPLLAEVYGMSAPAGDGFSQQSLPESRAGLLTSGAVMAAISPSDRTSPTHRGKFVLEQLFCEEVPPPPPNVDDVIEQPTPEEGLTLKEKLAQHREDPACASCHNLIDPLGFTFEHFDAIGQFRDVDNGNPVDATGEYDGETFDGVADLVDYVVANPKTTSCIAERLYAFASGHQADGAEPEVVELITENFRSHKSFKSLMVELVMSDAFRYLQPGDMDAPSDESATGQTEQEN
jgi:hypothetical protein